jgi:hypothetical protein
MPNDRRKLFPILLSRNPTRHEPFQNLQGTSCHHLERVTTSSFPGVSAIVALCLPLPFPGRNLGKVAKLGLLCKSYLTIDSFFQEVKGNARHWRQRQECCGVMAKNKSGAVSFQFERVIIVGNSRMLTR